MGAFSALNLQWKCRALTCEQELHLSSTEGFIPTPTPNYIFQMKFEGWILRETANDSWLAENTSLLNILWFLLSAPKAQC